MSVEHKNELEKRAKFLKQTERLAARDLRISSTDEANLAYHADDLEAYVAELDEGRRYTQGLKRLKTSERKL